MSIIIKELNLTQKEFEKLEKKAKREKVEVLELIRSILKEKINESIFLGNGFSYNLSTSKLYKYENEIHTTKIQNKIFHLLIKNNGKVLNSEDFQNTAWKGKNMSIYTLRNKIKEIRDMTYYELILSHSNLGYILPEIVDGQVMEHKKREI